MPRSQFQSFDETTDPSHGPARLAALRAELARRDLDGFIVPRADEHQGEYVPKNAERLAWLAGFTGSAGTAIVLRDKACIIVDGRYTLQAREQVDTTAFAPVPLADKTSEAWIEDNLPSGATLAYDPWLHTPEGVKRLSKAAERAGGRLVAVESNPIDAVWSDRPTAPAAPVRLHDIKFAGESVDAKLARIREQMAKQRLDGLVVSDPHNLAWAFNIRGGDVPHTPLPLGYALLPRDEKPMLFLDPAKLGDEVRQALSSVARLATPTDFPAAIAALAKSGAKVRIDAGTGAAALEQIVSAAGGTPDVAPDPIALMKASKNAGEIEGSRAAHRRDGAAVTNFLAWLDGEAPKGRVTEIEAAEMLEDFRRRTNALMDLSFPTISGAGPNAALPHYRVTRRSNRVIEPGIFLVDSGAQYQDGTTDITRTVAVGPPTPEMRAHYTRVLKGHIAIATAVFPKGTSGAQLDAFARRPLWDIGTDFDHGTGHGVGAYLSVHEGPQRLSKVGTVALEPGMILSNEPGYYREGHYGIRIENLILVEARQIEGAERPMLGFETLSFAPIDTSLIAPELMTAQEIAWLDAYHAKVREVVSPLVDTATRTWLAARTAPLRAK
jgi:Xaa-Pro aminopeptidase